MEPEPRTPEEIEDARTARLEKLFWGCIGFACLGPTIGLIAYLVSR